MNSSQCPTAFWTTYDVHQMDDIRMLAALFPNSPNSLVAAPGTYNRFPFSKTSTVLHIKERQHMMSIKWMTLGCWLHFFLILRIIW